MTVRIAFMSYVHIRMITNENKLLNLHDILHITHSWKYLAGLTFSLY